MGGFDSQDGADGVVAAEAAPAPPPPPPRFRAAYAILAFVLFSGAQLVAGVAVAVVAVAMAAARGKSLANERVVAAAVNDSVVIGIVAAFLASTLVALLVARPLRRDPALGLTVPPWRQTLFALIAGMAVAGCYAALLQVVPSRWEGGPLARLLEEHPSARIVVTLGALLYAPVIEELLFRGVMLRGMIASWGVRVAGVVVTLLFVLSHILEVVGYWPALAAMIAISIVTLVARLRSGSLLPAVAAHFGYNAVTAMLLYIPVSS